MATKALTVPLEAPLPVDPQVRLHLPKLDTSDPELSIVIPALNEELTIAEFVRWCRQDLADAGIQGEILIVDSSTDGTREIALAEGARVLQTPKRGLGRAYIDALPFARGRYLLLGDCDCTYDFRELRPFVEAFRAGAEFIMGSRFRGSIEPGAMPPLHQYFGTPFTTWILNVLYSSHFSDIHCGMRGITRAAFVRMNLQSQSWEYASEMVLKSVHMRLETAEVPVKFYKDQEGRLSHHKRSGWFSPWHAGWINLRAMLVYGADFFLLRPGAALLGLGGLVTAALLGGPLRLFGIEWSLHAMLAGWALTILGLAATLAGAVAQTLYDREGSRRARWLRRLPYTPAVIASAFLVLAGAGLVLPLAHRWLSNRFLLSIDGLHAESHLAVGGLTLASAGFLLFNFTLLLHAVAAHAPLAAGPGGQDAGK